MPSTRCNDVFSAHGIVDDYTKRDCNFEVSLDVNLSKMNKPTDINRLRQKVSVN